MVCVPMSAWSTLAARLSRPRVSARDVRAASFFLGNRHKGEIRAGAEKELLAPNLSADRIALLRAVIRMTPPANNQGPWS
jgi:hypothetical protein